MMTYQDKVTCDKETFLRSKIEHEFFRQLEYKPMKGITKPGPVYEFDYYGLVFLTSQVLVRASGVQNCRSSNPGRKRDADVSAYKMLK